MTDDKTDFRSFRETPTFAKVLHHPANECGVSAGGMKAL
jgi:hypothetical protein